MKGNLVLGRFGLDESHNDVVYFDHNNIIFKTSKKVNKAYHYTNVEKLEKILKSGSFFSTDCRYQNDPNEFLLGYRTLVKELKEDPRVKEFSNYDDVKNLPKEFFTFLATSSSEITPYKNNFSSIFTTSFCKDADDLSQWDRYAGECGIAIEVDFTLLKERACLAICNISDDASEKKYMRINTIPFYIAYSKSDVMRLVDALVSNYTFNNRKNEANILYIGATINLLACHIKDKRYSNEQEIRLSFFPYRAAAVDDSFFNCELIYTEDNHRLIPHVPVYCFKNDINHHSPQELDPQDMCGWPIKKIVVGPGSNQEAVFESLIHRMEAGGTKVFKYTDKEIAREKIKHAKDAQNWQNSNGLELTEAQQLAFDEITALTNEIKKVQLLQYYKYQCLADIFIPYEKTRYCTSQGIILERSNLQYNFKKR